MSFGSCRCHGLPTPFGGPGSGLWPTGGGSTPPPPPPPLPPIVADILADCFAACAGVISQGAPGPICGWTYFTSLSGPASTVTFSQGSMTFDCPTSNEAPAASKPISISGVNDRTVHFTFHEFNDIQASIAYMIIVTDLANTNALSINLESNGSVSVAAGLQANIPFYSGTWTPNGGFHTVHLTVDASGLPRLWIDGAEITLTLIGSAPFAGYPADSVVANFSDLNNDAIARTSVLESLFITTGQILPTRTFRCP